MKKLMKILKKVAFSVVCFLLLPCLMMSINRTNSIAAPTDGNRFIAYISLDTPEEKILISESAEIIIKVGVRFNGNDHMSLTIVPDGFRIKVLSGEDVRTEEEFVDGEGYTDRRITIIADKNSTLNKAMKNPETTDIYGEKAYIIELAIKLPAVVEGTGPLIKDSAIAIHIANLKEWSGETADFKTVYCKYVSDEKYIAFGSSYDEAEKNLYGDFGYFWRVTVPEFFNGLFDGCDDDETMDY